MLLSSLAGMAGMKKHRSLKLFPPRCRGMQAAKELCVFFRACSLLKSSNFVTMERNILCEIVAFERNIQNFALQTQRFMDSLRSAPGPK